MAILLQYCCLMSRQKADPSWNQSCRVIFLQKTYLRYSFFPCHMSQNFVSEILNSILFLLRAILGHSILFWLILRASQNVLACLSWTADSRIEFQDPTSSLLAFYPEVYYRYQISCDLEFVPLQTQIPFLMCETPKPVRHRVGLHLRSATVWSPARRMAPFDCPSAAL